MSQSTLDTFENLLYILPLFLSFCKNVSLPYAAEYSFLTCGTELTSNAKKSLPYMVEYCKPKLFKTFSLQTKISSGGFAETDCQVCSHREHWIRGAPSKQQIYFLLLKLHIHQLCHSTSYWYQTRELIYLQESLMKHVFLKQTSGKSIVSDNLQPDHTQIPVVKQ